MMGPLGECGFDLEGKLAIFVAEVAIAELVGRRVVPTQWHCE